MKQIWDFMKIDKRNSEFSEKMVSCERLTKALFPRRWDFDRIRVSDRGNFSYRYGNICASLGGMRGKWDGAHTKRVKRQSLQNATGDRVLGTKEAGVWISNTELSNRHRRRKWIGWFKLKLQDNSTSLANFH